MKVGHSSESGFTLIELLVVIATIAIMAAIAIPYFAELRERAHIAATATEMKQLVAAFEAYFASNETYPNDSHRDVPTGMEKLIPAVMWAEETPVGGYYNWEGPDSYPYAGISIWSHSASLVELAILDRMLDNGNLGTGRFRVTANGRPTFIVDE